ncbi:MAG: hypothetical protein AAGH72_09845, partial [Verrucomicrobiota bacterium]
SAIREWESVDALEALMTEALDHYGIHIEELSEKRWLLTKGHLLQDELAVIPDEGKTVTLDRRQALERDDVEFLTWDHPLTASILDYLLGSETGNTAFVEVTAPEGLERGLYAELVFILEGSCPPEFDIQRFLPMTPIRVVCDQNGAMLQSDQVSRLEQAAKTDVASHVLSSNTEVLKALLQPIKSESEQAAETEAERIKSKALKQVEGLYGREQERLQELRDRNGLVSEAEIMVLQKESRTLVKAIQSSQLRLDALRLFRAV